MLELKNINKIYISNKTKALIDINISFRDKEFVSVIGPSGCGKTTLLNIIGGLDVCTTGDLLINGLSTSVYRERDWDNYRNNRIGFVFQSYNLISYLNVFENIELAITLSKYDKKTKKAMVEEVIKKVSLQDVSYSYPNQLSGGQMQRVAIARALVSNPDIILTDEPTGALDSSTANQIISLLKDISKEKLVIMVTHNEKIAEKFSTRIISLLDGNIISDSNPYKIVNKEYDYIPKDKKSYIGFLTSIKISSKSLYTKKIRTLLVILAGSVGIIGVTLIMTISGGIDKYINELQRNALSDAPITIYTTYDYNDPNEDNTIYEEFPDYETVNIVTKRNYYSHLNIFSENFLNYLNEIDDNLYQFIDYSGSLRMNIFRNTNTKIEKLNTTYFTETSDNDFALDQYTVLSGKMATESNELVLLVDKYNNLNSSVLLSLGMDIENKTSFTFEELIGLKYQLVLNNDYYYKNESGIYQTRSILDIDFTKAIGLEIVGIIRIEENAELDIYKKGILYNKKLSDFLLNNAINSDIVKEQLEYGLDRNVRTGEPYEDQVSSSTIITKEYLYEYSLVLLSYKPEITTIKIYTDKFSSRININRQLAEYNNNVIEKDKIHYTDYYGRIVEEFNAFVEVLTNVLIVFASIALFVSSIMISIISYVSVLERTKEIGTLRSLGASKMDIANVFNAENAIIGFLSGFIGIIVSVILMNPIIKMISNILKNNNIRIFDLTEMNISIGNPIFTLLIIIGSVILTILAGLIPAIIGARKVPVNAIRS